MSNIVKKQMYLTPSLDYHLKRVARSMNVSESHVIREALEAYVAESHTIDPFDEIIGIGAGEEAPADLAANHDEYLYDLPGRA